MSRPPEVYVSVDVEAAGPIPGAYSMLALGAVVVGAEDESFYAELRPLNDAAVPEALRVSGFSLEALRVSGAEPQAVMERFRAWVHRVSRGSSPVFVAFNATFDWAFVNWYFHTFLGENPFGIGGLDIKAYYMGLTGCLWRETTSSQLPDRFRPEQRQTHNARDDARAQAQMFAKMLAAARPA